MDPKQGSSEAASSTGKRTAAAAADGAPVSKQAKEAAVISAATDAPVAVEALAVVSLHRLVGAAQYNGKRGSVVGFATNLGRFTVRMEPDGLLLRVKPKCMELVSVPVGIPVIVVGLGATCQHNGEEGTVVGSASASGAGGCFVVQFDGGAKVEGVKAANMRLVERNFGAAAACTRTLRRASTLTLAERVFAMYDVDRSVPVRQYCRSRDRSSLSCMGGRPASQIREGER
eukprot:SAG11_NODE_4677_length_1809_cov_1.292811_2_plen_230_part_00